MSELHDLEIFVTASAGFVIARRLRDRFNPWVPQPSCTVFSDYSTAASSAANCRSDLTDSVFYQFR